MINKAVLTIILTLGVSVLWSQDWTRTLTNVGTFSSPRAVDLNQDNILDIVIGAGQEEFKACDTAVIALDGSNGEVLWAVPARDQIFGSAAVGDVNRDQIPDVFIGGRGAELLAINGKSGEILWEFYPEGDSLKPANVGLYNFYNPQWIPDQDNDGIRDLIIANGGDVTAPPYDPNRPPGHLIVVSGQNGKQLARAKMPDNKEIYMSAVIVDLENDGQLEVIYGTGGETIGGNLWKCQLRDVMNEDLKHSSLLAYGENKGFIGPPVIADLNEDNILDVAINAVEGIVYAIDGKTNRFLWMRKIDDTEAYSSLAVGDINKDGTADFFGMYADGVWPDLRSTRPFAVNGKTGELAFIDSIGFYQTSSPSIADFNGDGYLDAMISVNFFAGEVDTLQTIHNTLLVYDLYNQNKFTIVDPVIGSCVASTPWIGDLDGDQKLDLVYTMLTRPDKTYTFDGFRIIRKETDINIPQGVPWGAYMGNQYDGIYRNK